MKNARWRLPSGVEKSKAMEQKRFELSTPTLRTWCSSQLSYCPLTEKPSVTLHQLPYNEENIDGRHTVGNQAGDIVALAVAFTLDEGLIPE